MVRGMMRLVCLLLTGWSLASAADVAPTQDSKLERLEYNHPDLAVDLGAGLWAWPLPMDVNGDGRMDMVINEEDVPYNGVYVYENPGSNEKMPIFKPASRLSDGINSSNATWLRQTERRDGKWYFEDRGPLDPRRLAGHTTCPTAVDFDNNGIPDVVIGAEDGHFYYLRNPRAKQ